MKPRRTRTLALATSISALGSVLGFAQAPQPPASLLPPEQAPPVFRTAADVVLLDIVVRDRRGRPLRDLRQDEITVLEDGIAREVRSFRLVEGGPSTPPLDATPASPEPLRRLTLVTLVFDRLSQGGRQLARKAALEFASRDLPPGQWVSVFTLDQRLTMRQDFTRDRAALTRAIELVAQTAAREDRVALPAESHEHDPTPTAIAAAAQGDGGASGPSSGRTGTAASDPAQEAIAAVTNSIQRFARTTELQQRGQSTLFPLMALAKAEGALEGRKAVLLFSEGFEVPANLEEAFRSTISEANRANVSFYTVDARGLETGRALAAAGAALERAGRTTQAELARQGAGPVSLDEVMNNEQAQSALHSNTQAVLEDLATSTGGFLIGNTNDLDRGLDRVASDLASYYEIAYVPQVAPFDGRFRKVEVKVARKSVEVQSRSGYFALPPSDAAPLMPYELPLLAAAAAAAPPHAFDYRVSAFRFHQTPRGRQHTLVVEVPLSGLTFVEDKKARKYTLRFDIMAIVKDSSGRIVERMSNAYPLEGPLERLEALRRGNIAFKRQLWLPPGRYTLSTVARDQASSRVSMRTIDLDVPAEREGVRVSALSIIRRVDRAGEQPDPFDDPFRSGPMRIVPSLDTPISKSANTTLSAYVVVYPDATRRAAPELAFEFAKDGKAIGRSAAVLPPADGQGRVGYVATFSIEGFAPGSYQLRAVAGQEGAQDVAVASFTVVP